MTLTLIYVLGACAECGLVVWLWWKDTPPIGTRIACAVASALFVALWPFTIYPTASEALK